MDGGGRIVDGGVRIDGRKLGVSRWRSSLDAVLLLTGWTGGEPSDEEGRGFEEEALDIVRERLGSGHDGLAKGASNQKDVFAIYKGVFVPSNIDPIDLSSK